MEIIPFDLETTGVDPFSDVPVSFYLGGESRIVNPGRPIPKEASDIHGITDDIAKDGIPLIDAAFYLRNTLEAYWFKGDIIIGMNVAYDLTMVEALANKHSSFMVVGPVLDVLVIDRHVDKYRKGSRTLSSLCDTYGVVLENAHTAAADAEACVAIFSKMLKKYPELKTLSLKDNKTLRFWHQEWLTNYSDYRVANGESAILPGRYEWPIHKKD